MRSVIHGACVHKSFVRNSRFQNHPPSICIGCFFPTHELLAGRQLAPNVEDMAERRKEVASISTAHPAVLAVECALLRQGNAPPGHAVEEHVHHAVDVWGRHVGASPTAAIGECAVH